MMEQLYNLKQLEDLSGGSRDFILEIVKIFILEIPFQLNELEKALEENNNENISKISHKIKPSIDLLDIKSIIEAIRILEYTTVNNINKLETNKLFNIIKTDLNLVIMELKIEFNI